MPDDTDDGGTPDTDPRHLDPAGDLAGLFEDGALADATVEDADREELREFLDAVDAGEYDPADPGLEATVRIVRALLDDE
jgi:hypothetical protein